MAPEEAAFRVDPETMAHLKRVAGESVAGPAQVHKALADERRVTILRLLQESELCVCDLVEIFDLEYSKLSYHLKQLRGAGLVETDREGNYVTYELTDRGEVAAERLEQFETDEPD